jgi:predicted nucleotidyltransferase
MNYKQNGGNPGFDRDSPNRVPSLLSRLIDPVQSDQAMLILKHQCRQLEADSVVFALVLTVFPLIPFVAHCVYTNYITREEVYAPSLVTAECFRSRLWDLGLPYLPAPIRPSASIRLIKISLMRVRCPSPLERSQSSTRGSRQTLTATLRLAPRSRTRFASRVPRLHVKYCSAFLLQMQYTFTAMISLGSELRRNLLTFFYVNRSARVYVRQLAGELQADSTNVSRELARLEREGLLRSETEGRQLYYSINRNYPYLKPLFTMLQGSIGIRPALQRALKGIRGVQSAWIIGSFARNEADAASDIDLLIVGQPDQTQLASVTSKAEKALRREINYTVLTSSELERRLQAGDAFVSGIWNGKRIELIGDGQDKAAKSRSEASEAVPG